jgi:hypothetical protein
MPRRLSENTRLWCYRYLVIRDGEKCAYCGALPATRNEDNVSLKLEINHIDQDSFNWAPANLNLACKGCNLAIRNHESCAPHQDSACKEKNKESHPSTRIVRTVVDYSRSDAPIPMQANFLFEVSFREYVLNRVRDNGFVAEDDAIYAGAERVGCSPQATRCYLKKLVSSEGCLTRRKDMLGGWMLEYKPEHRQASLIPQESQRTASKT